MVATVFAIQRHRDHFATVGLHARLFVVVHSFHVPLTNWHPISTFCNESVDTVCYNLQVKGNDWLQPTYFKATPVLQAANSPVLYVYSPSSFLFSQLCTYSWLLWGKFMSCHLGLLAFNLNLTSAINNLLTILIKKQGQAITKYQRVKRGRQSSYFSKPSTITYNY